MIGTLNSFVHVLTQILGFSHHMLTSPEMELTTENEDGTTQKGGHVLKLFISIATFPASKEIYLI